VRNDAVHSALKESERGHVFENRAKGRVRTKAEIFSCEDLTNYASQLAVAFRFALGFKEGPSLRGSYQLRQRYRTSSGQISQNVDLDRRGECQVSSARIRASAKGTATAIRGLQASGPTPSGLPV
jgi:hypothetical protein